MFLKKKLTEDLSTDIRVIGNIHIPQLEKTPIFLEAVIGPICLKFERMGFLKFQKTFYKPRDYVLKPLCGHWDVLEDQWLWGRY